MQQLEKKYSPVHDNPLREGSIDLLVLPQSFHDSRLHGVVELLVCSLVQVG